MIYMTDSFCGVSQRDITEGFPASMRESANEARHTNPCYPLNSDAGNTYTLLEIYAIASLHATVIRDAFIKPLPPVSGTSKHSRMQLNSMRKRTYLNEVIHIGQRNKSETSSGARSTLLQLRVQSKINTYTYPVHGTRYYLTL